MTTRFLDADRLAAALIEDFGATIVAGPPAPMPPPRTTPRPGTCDCTRPAIGPHATGRWCANCRRPEAER